MREHPNQSHSLGLCLFQQMGQQNLALGLKFNAKAVLDCFEKELEILPHGRRREIDFKMVEGDFQLFEGKWSIEQVIIILLLSSNTFHIPFLRASFFF